MIDYKIKRSGEKDVHLLIELSGQLDTVGCESLTSVIENELTDDVERLIVDCQNLEYISSRGLGALVQIHTRMKKRGGQARLAGVQGVIAEVIHMVMLDKVLHLYPSVEEATREE